MTRLPLRRVMAASAGVILLAALPAAAESVSEGTWHPAVPAWDAYAVGPGERTVVLDYQDQCGFYRNVRATVHETRSTVDLSVAGEQYEPPPGSPVMPCPDAFASLTVRLGARLAGRAIGGRAPGILHAGAESLGSPQNQPPGLPRLVGFDLADAKHVLLRLGMRWRIVPERLRSGRARVLAQRPAPGASYEQGATVRIYVATP